MKKVAVMIYPDFCMFEIAPTLEQLAMEGVDNHIFALDKGSYRSEEGFLTIADYSIEEIDESNYEALLFTGFQNENPPVGERRVNQLILDFYKSGKLVGAISAGPVFLLAAGVLEGKEFLCGCPYEGLLEEGFSEEQLSGMIVWEEAVKQVETLKFIQEGNIVTANAYGYREFAMIVSDMIGIEPYPKLHGLSETWKATGRIKNQPLGTVPNG